MTNDEQEQKNITEEEIINAVKAGQTNWFLRLSYSPGGVAIMVLIICCIAILLTLVVESGQLEDATRFLESLIP